MTQNEPREVFPFQRGGRGNYRDYSVGQVPSDTPLTAPVNVPPPVQQPPAAEAAADPKDESVPASAHSVDSIERILQGDQVPPAPTGGGTPTEASTDADSESTEPSTSNEKKKVELPESSTPSSSETSSVKPGRPTPPVPTQPPTGD